jgi:hypothetical protein
MITTTSPFVKLSQGETPPDSTEENALVSATVGAEVKLRPFEELSQHNWEWSAKGVLQDNIERAGLFFASLNDGLDNDKEYRERYISVRFIQNRPGNPLKMVMLTRITADSQKISDAVKNCWHEMLSVHHYDYMLSPISSEEDLHEKTGQSWLLDKSKFPSVSILYPAVGFLNVSGKDHNHSIPIVGKWAPTTTSLESVWRALNNYPYPVLMDVLLKATFLRPDELVAFDTVLNDLEAVAEGSGGVVTRIQARHWFEMMINRLNKFAPLYMMQVRLATRGDMLSYLPRVVGAALTYQNTLDQNMPFQGFNIMSRRGVNTGDWAQRIAGLEFIDINVGLSQHLENLPLLATPSEVLSVARFLFMPKGGIPNLVVEEL